MSGPRVRRPAQPALANTATQAAVTAVRLRRAHRRDPRETDSCQAETGSSAIHRSTSSASARAIRSDLPGSDIAFRQTASSARSIAGSTPAGGESCPSAPREALGTSRRRTAAAGQEAVERGAETVDVGPRARVGPARPAACSGLM